MKLLIFVLPFALTFLASFRMSEATNEMEDLSCIDGAMLKSTLDADLSYLKQYRKFAANFNASSKSSGTAFDGEIWQSPARLPFDFKISCYFLQHKMTSQPTFMKQQSARTHITGMLKRVYLNVMGKAVPQRWSERVSDAAHVYMCCCVMNDGS